MQTLGSVQQNARGAGEDPPPPVGGAGRDQTGLSNSVEFSTKKRVPAHSAGPARDDPLPSAFPPKSLPPGHVLLEKNRVFQPLASLGLSLASLWPPLAAKGSQMELPGERKGAKMGPKPPQGTPDTPQDVQWIENGPKMEDKCLRIR